MEFFTVELTRRHGVTIAQAFALTMSIRLVQVLWNLVAGVFVLRGGYHAPSEREQQALDSDGEAPSDQAPVPPPRNEQLNFNPPAPSPTPDAS
jgi:hypothetical protein